ncbi:DUF6817 domain-containing protein [Streptomyces apocyni]|uniref:DUF6817 domain-containing protein n=1 Tax=Streptomyces apocyni TaxID=2654677 RepID=UPI0012E9A156|nr:hypothetical protein [Streptomyces apocyni]
MSSPVTEPSARAQAATALLITCGADTTEHPGGTLLAHLHRVQTLLATWGARPTLQLAGLCHAFYGTDGFPAALLDLSERPRLTEAIGQEAEELVYFYASCDRTATYPTLTATHAHAHAHFHDRFTGKKFTPPLPQLRDFAELTAANELDLAHANPDFRAKHGPDLLTLLTRFRPLLSENAWQQTRTTLTH